MSDFALHPLSGRRPDAAVNIVFIHGLGDDAFACWSSGQRTFWPALIADDFPQAAIWSLDHPAGRIASVWTGAGMDLLERSSFALDMLVANGMADRPLVFVTHSLGGLVAKCILRKSADSGEAEKRKICETLRAIVFLATPHDGADLAETLKRIPFLRDVVSNSIGDLRRNNTALHDLRDWYKNRIDHTLVRTKAFYETRKYRGVLVVEKASADPGVPWCDPVATDKDHISISKLESRDDPVYVSIKHFLAPLLAGEEMRTGLTPQPTLHRPNSHYQDYHFSAQALPLLGRDHEWKILTSFAEKGSTFKWMQIAGGGGQGKSRLAFKLSDHLEKQGWRAGFISADALLKFEDNWNKWQPEKPTLIIVDYIVGFEELVGKAMRALASRVDLRWKVRWLLVERHRWDRGNFYTGDPTEAGLAFSSATADWFSRMSEYFDARDLRGGEIVNDPSVIELQALSAPHLLEIVKQWCERRRHTVEESDVEIVDILRRIDPAGRPLYAYFLAEALASKYSVAGWTREDLLRATLTKDQKTRWASHFNASPPNISDDTPAVRLALLASLVSVLDVRGLKAIQGWAVPDTRTRREALALVDGAASSGASGPGNLIPKLEPDILGGWFILDALAAGSVPLPEIAQTAWQLAPTETSATLLRMAQDFPLHPTLHDLLMIDPKKANGQSAYTTIAQALFVAIRDRGVIKKVNLLPRLKAAAEAGDAAAMSKLGYCYKTGIGMDKPDVGAAVDWFRRGANAGSGSAMAYLGHCYFTGLGVGGVDYEQAVAWFKKGADLKDGQAMAYLGVCYDLGRAVPQNYDKAFECYTAGVEAGDALAMTYRGLYYQQGIAVPKNPDKAFESFLQAAQAGGAHAMAYVGECYERGDGVEADLSLALSWYEKGAKAGSGHAMGRAGQFYMGGIGPARRDPLEAIALFKRGADTGAGLPMALLALCYLDGVDVREDKERAKELLIAAARLDDPIAKAQLVKMGIDDG